MVINRVVKLGFFLFVIGEVSVILGRVKLLGGFGSWVFITYGFICGKVAEGFVNRYFFDRSIVFVGKIIFIVVCRYWVRRLVFI